MHFNLIFSIKRRLILIINLLFCVSIHTYSQHSNIALTFSQGHLGEVVALDISKEADIVISAGQDNKIKIWDVTQERLLRTINAHDIGISDVNISRDKKYIVSSGLDHSVKVWETKTGELLSEVNKLPESINEVKFFKNNVIFIDILGNIYDWDWSDTRSVRRWNEHLSEGISCFITRTKSNSWLALGKYDGSIEIWNTSVKKKKATKKMHKDWVTDLIYINKKKIIVSGGWDGTLRLWDLESNLISNPIFLPDGKAIRSITYSHSIDKIIVTSNGNHAYYYEVKDKSLHLLSKFDKKEIVTTAFNRKGELAVIAYKSGEISLIEIDGLNLKASWNPISDEAIDFTTSLNNGLIAVSSKKGNIRLWKSGSREDLLKWNAHTGAVSTLFFQNNGNLFTTGKDSTLKIWDDNSNFRLLKKKKYQFPIHKAIPLKEESLVLIVNNGGDVYLQDVIDLNNTKKVFSSYQTINSIKLSHDGSLLAIALGNRTVHILDVQNSFSEIKKIRIKDRYLNSLAFSMDKELLAIGGRNKLIIYNLNDHIKVNEIKVKHPISSIDFTYDNNSFIYSEQAGDLKLYDKYLTKEKFIYHENKGDVIQLFDFPGKQVFVTLSTDFSVGIWDLESPNKYGAVLSDGDVGWVVEHYSGLFDASKANMNNLYYVVDNETIDLSQLQGMYWEPGLGTKLFTGENLRKVPFLSSVSLFPEANLYKRNNKVFVEVVDRGGGIGKVAVLVNGKEVIEDITPYKVNLSVDHLNLLNQKEKTIKYSVPLDSLSFLFQSGGSLNDITVRVENQEGTLSGRGLTIKHKSKNDKKEIPSFYGIIVGVSDYRGSTLDLKYAALDAEKMASSIENSAIELFGEHRVNIELFSTNQSDPLRQPNKENIRRSFDSLQHIATPSDILFVFLAGHGMAVKEKNGDEDFYFLTKDMLTADLTDNSIKENYTIAGKEWLEWMKKIPITKQVFIMDACNAGKFAETIVAMRSVDDEAVRLRALERVRTRSGMFLLAGSAADKVSYESTMYGQGLLTYSILDYLKRGSLRKGEFLDVQLMFGNAVDEVPRLAERFGASQQPEMRIPEGGDSFDIGRVTEKVKNDIYINTTLARVSSSHFENDSTWVDELSLGNIIDEKLLRLSEGLNSGFNFFTFSPFASGKGVYKIKGRYIVKEEEVYLLLKIVEGTNVLYRNNYSSSDKEELAEDCINDIVSFFKDL